jgi:hypothetical protein
MATRSKQVRSEKATDEAPIKHTAGGEMPDTSEQHHVTADQLSEFGEVEGESKAWLDNVKSYAPWILGTVGIGFGIYFLVRRFTQEGMHQDTIQESSDITEEEGKRAQDVDNVQPSRLMGA